MIWLVTEMWAFLLAAFVFGAAAGIWIVAGRKRAVAQVEAKPSSERAMPEPKAPALLTDAPNVQKDDLTQIIGIDRDTERRLNQLGIYHLSQIAAWDDGAARWIETRLNDPGRVERERWTDQASGAA